MPTEGNKQQLSIGEFLIKKGIITKRQLDAALAIQRDRYKKLHENFNVTLVRKGIVSKQEMNRIFEEVSTQQGEVGMIFLKKGLISEKQYQAVLEKQEKDKKSFGEVVVALGYLSEDFFYNFLKKNVNLVKINNLLLKREIITQEDFDKILRMQKVGHRLGEILLYLEYVDEKTLYNIFSEQSGLPLKSLKDFVYKQDNIKILRKILGKQYAQDYSLVPLSVNPPDLVIAISDPFFISEINQVKRFYEEDFKVEYWLALKSEIEKLQDKLYNLPLEEEQIRERRNGIISSGDVYKYRFKDKSDLLPSNPESFNTFINLGKSYQEMGMHEDALAEFRKASQSPKFFVESNLLMAACYEKQGDYEAAIKTCEEALQQPYITQRSGMELKFELGNLYAKKGERRKALGLFESIYKMNPKYKDVAEKIRKLNL